MNIYAIGDLHLSLDPRIDKPMDIFGNLWKDHYVKLEENWRSTVKEEDIVIIAGDVSWGLRLEEAMADLNWISKLPGYKVITKGNHDLWWMSTNKLNTLFDNITFLQSHSFQCENGTVICGTRGWSCPGSEDFTAHDLKIYNRESLRLKMALDEVENIKDKDVIAVLHYPPTNDKFQESNFTRLMTEYGVSDCVFGHLHGSEVFKKGLKGIYNGVRYKLVSLDYLNCKLEKIR